MAQSAAALFILAAFAAAAAASVAQAASASSEIAGVKNHLLPAGRKLLADDGMIPITSNDLMPLSAGKAVTSGRAAGVAIQRELKESDGMIPITTNDLMPLSDGQAVTSGRAAGVAIQRELIDDADLWFPKDDFDKARSGVAGVQSQRQLIDNMIPITANDLLPLSAAEGLTKGRAGNVNIQTDLTGAKVPAA